MKVGNPVSKVTKMEATRMLMKDRAKSKGRILKNELDQSTISDVGPSSGSVSQSMNNTNLDSSMT